MTEPDPEIAVTPQPPYTAVIFTSIRTDGDNGYAAMAAQMDELAAARRSRRLPPDVQRGR